ncbi:MAG: hypothetical protein UX23_C0005G0012 [Parcubacteria group bacterium GW2011_GWB1_45_9]|nr:MAG: hypothetical protein UX23_C0005G0012 [Parcubacteria group bacterium GW2011_GWB1_45_9]
MKRGFGFVITVVMYRATQLLLLAVTAVIPFIYTGNLYFPFISGKIYVFRMLVALAFFFWIWLMLKSKEYRPDFKNILVIAVILFFFAQVAAAFFGVDPAYSFFSGIERQDGVFQFGFWVLYFLMLVSVFRSERDWEALFYVFVAVAVLTSAYSWFTTDSSEYQLSGIFGNPAYLGAYLLFAIGFALIQRTIILYSAVGFLALTLIFTQIRGAYVGLAGGIFLFAVLTLLFLRKESKWLAYVCGIILLIGAISLSALFAARDTAFVQNVPILTRVTEVANFWEVPSVKERLLNWSIAIKAFKERPVFGYGPENFGVAANKYYDYRVGQGEPWFDRAHNRPFDTLATGGTVVFSFYLLWLFAAAFLIWKIGIRQPVEKKILSFTLASILSAYFLQSLFLFDTIAVYLGLFPFLAFLVYRYQKIKETASDKMAISYKLKAKSYTLIFTAALLSLFTIYTTVLVPWRANNAAWQFFNLTENGFYAETRPYLETAFAINSPYTYWESRKMTSWQFRNILEYRVDAETDPDKLAELRELYDFLIPEFERHIEARPTYPQMYDTLSAIYRFGYEKLGKDDLDKAEAVLRKAFNYSDLRIEYYNQFAVTLLLMEKFEEAEETLKAHMERVPPEWGADFPFIMLGNFYFEAEKHQLALEQYEKAIAVGFEVYKNTAVYPRYMLAAEKLKDYQKVVDTALLYLKEWGPDADTHFNLAVGYFNLGEMEPARKFFFKAVEMNSEYEQFRSIFE